MLELSHSHVLHFLACTPLQDTKHRRLTWIYSLGSCMVKGNFEPKVIEMQMSTMQATICVLFNDVEELTYNEIRVSYCT